MLGTLGMTLLGMVIWQATEAPVKLKILQPDGAPAQVQHGVSIATMGYTSERPRIQFFHRNAAGSVSLPDLPAGEHLLLLDSGWEHRDLMTLTFPVEQPIVEWQLPDRTEFAGKRVELSSARAATDAGIEVIRLEIHNDTAEVLHVSERDITLTTPGFRVLSPRYLTDVPDHHPTRELSIDIAPGETKLLDLEWADWVRHGYWSKRFEPVAEVSPAHEEPGRVWVRPWLGNIGSRVVALTDPTTIVTADETTREEANHGGTEARSR